MYTSSARIPLSGRFNGVESEAIKSISSNVSPPLPFVIVSLPLVPVVKACIARILAGPTEIEPVPVTRLARTSELAIHYSFLPFEGLFLGSGLALTVAGVTPMPRRSNSSLLGCMIFIPYPLRCGDCSASIRPLPISAIGESQNCSACSAIGYINQRASYASCGRGGSDCVCRDLNVAYKAVIGCYWTRKSGISHFWILTCKLG